MLGKGLSLGLLLLGTLIGVPDVRGQERNISIVLKGNLTTASRVFTDPNSPDPVERSQYYSLEDFFGYGLELRYQVPETNIAFGLSVDHIKTSTGQSVTLSTTRAIPVEDGYEVIPVELTGYFIIPVSGRTFGIYMGGGVGGYFGRRLYTYGTVDAPTVQQGHGFGIHVLGGVSYRLTDWFCAIVEMKFRDLQFQTTNQFPSSTIIYQGLPVAVNGAPFDALVHTDGVMFQLGTAFSF